MGIITLVLPFPVVIIKMNLDNTREYTTKCPADAAVLYDLLVKS